MIGVFRKDCYMIFGAFGKNLLLVSVMYAALVLMMKNISFLAILIWITAFYGLSLITMDNTCGWDCYARTLPVSSGAVIAARFLVTLLLMFVAAGYALVLGAVLYFFMDYGEIGELLTTVALVTAAALVVVGLLLPAAYKWGVEKVRNTFLLVFMLVFLTPTLLRKWLGSGFAEEIDNRLEGLTDTTIAAGALVAGLLVFAFGGWLSSRIYAKKEF